MIIAHAPAGYLLAKSLLKPLAGSGIKPGLLLAAVIFGSLAPDLDMLYFYLIDNCRTHHHKYVTHWPVLWLGLSLIASVACAWGKTRRTGIVSLLVCGAAMLHLLLDSLVGDVWWLAPFVDKPYAMFTVAARFKPWWLNFILHWSFAVELGIWLGAVLVYWRTRVKRADF